MELFKLFATLGLKTKDFELGMKMANEDGKDLAKKMKGHVSAFTIAGGNLLAGAVRTAGGFLVNLGKTGMDYNAKMEMYTSKFSTMLGSVEEGEKKVESLRKMAAYTPYGMEDLADATDMMMKFGVATEDTEHYLSVLGDIAMGDKNNLQGLAYAFSQMYSTGKLMGQDKMQMINAGFNPLQVIAEKTKVSLADLNQIMSGGKKSEQFVQQYADAKTEVEKLGEKASDAAKMIVQMGDEGQISADVVTRAFEIATEAGGMFYKGSEAGAKTQMGTISTLKDNWETLLGKIMQPVSNWMTETMIPKAIEAVDKLSAAYDEGGLQGMAQAAWEMLKQLGSELMTFIEPALADATNGIKDWFKENLNIELPNWDEVKEGFSNLWEVVSGAFTWISENGETVKTGLITIGAGFTAMWIAAHPVASFIGLLIASIPALIDDVKAAFTDISNWVGDVIQNFNDLAESISAAIEELTAFFEVGGAKKSLDENYPEFSEALDNGQLDTFSGTLDFIFGGGNKNKKKNKNEKPHATGLNYVPYDEYPARLHQGEAVLTKAQAQNWRKGQGNGGFGIDYTRLGQSVAQAMRGMSVQMDGEQVGNIVTDTVSRNIAKSAQTKRRFSY